MIASVVGVGLADVSRVATGGLIAAVWQGILLAGAVWLGLKLLPKTPAAVRFAVWFGVFAVVTALPVAALLSRTGGPAVSGHAVWLTLDARWCLAIAAVWAMASAVRAGTLLLAGFRVRALWKRARPLDLVAGGTHLKGMMWSIQVEEARKAELCVSDEVDRPTVIGFFAPKILIPAWLVEKLTPEELTQIVLHEAGHLGRADDWMNLLQKIALVVFPLNPALAWVERRLCFERELACDERVLHATGAPKAYAACLATLAEHRLRRRGVALALGALGRESELGRRVGRILERRQLMRPVHAKLVLGGAMLGLLTAAAGLERCPRVVGFASAGGSSMAASEPVRMPTGLRGSYEYQAVVFHSNKKRMNSLDAKVNVPHETELTYRKPVAPAVEKVTKPMDATDRVDSRAYGMHSVSLKSGAAPTTVRPTTVRKTDVAAVETQNLAEKASSQGLVQWVVVTAWQNADGSRTVSRMLLTSAVGSDSTSRSAGTVAPMRVVSGEAQSFGSVYSYAAVPVRGGWLVLQL